MRCTATWFFARPAVIRLLGLALALAAGAALRPAPVVAQAGEEQVQDLVDPTVWVLAPGPDPDVDRGGIAVMEGIADEAGVRFKVPDLDIMQPVQVILMTPDPADDLRLELRKYHWSAEPDRQGSTGESGLNVQQIRTQGDLYLRVASPDALRPYRLAVWVGEPVEPERQPAVVPFTAEFTGTSGRGVPPPAGATPILYVIAVLLGAIVLLLGVAVLRRVQPGLGGS